MGIKTCDELKQHVDDGAVLVDVRTPGEFNQARLPGATLVPLSQLPRISEVADTDTKVLLYCRTGARSGQAEHYLKQMGYDAENVGGVIHYMQCVQY